MSKIVSIATGVPEYEHHQRDIFEFADAVYNAPGDERERRKLKFLYEHSGINRRFSVMPDYSSSISERQFYPQDKSLEPFPNLEKRMEWFADNATNLSVKTIHDCIRGKIEPHEITHLVTVSCTGMSAPGLDLQVMEALKLPGNTWRTSVNFMGCYAAIHALKIAHSICETTEGANVMIVCTEFCTLHFQKENTIDNITATLLFADGCAALLMQDNRKQQHGLSITNFYSDVSFRGKADMSWLLSSKGFLMSLSGYVPDLLEKDFNLLLENALKKSCLQKNEVGYWCIHPGGKKILQAIEKSIQLNPGDLIHSYEVLKNFGNMSSPTIVFVLKEILQTIERGNPNKEPIVFGAAFGPGLTMETFTAVYV